MAQANQGPNVAADGQVPQDPQIYQIDPQRLHFLVPLGKNLTDVVEELLKLGSVDYINFKAMDQKTPPKYMGFVRFTTIEAVERATHALEKVYGPRSCAYARKYDQSPYFKRCEECNHVITSHREGDHLTICAARRDIEKQRPKVHYFCGRIVDHDDWDRHLRDCDPYKFDHVSLPIHLQVQDNEPEQLEQAEQTPTPGRETDRKPISDSEYEDAEEGDFDLDDLREELFRIQRQYDQST